jgi:hypothetical protein
MKKVLKSTSGRYGLVELVDEGTAWGLRNSIRVDGHVKESSNDLNALVRNFEERP